MKNVGFLLCLCCVLFGCRAQHYSPYGEPQWEEIPGRNQYYCASSVVSLPVYRVKAPSSWYRCPSPAPVLLHDTTVPLCEFLLEGGAVRVTVHNFPNTEKIPPSAQVFRWQQQFDRIAPENVSIEPFSRSGFTGLYFEGTGLKGDCLQTVVAWSMQLGAVHDRALGLDTSPLAQERRADCTIKAVGPESLMRKHILEIQNFAKTFELIQPLSALV